MYDHIEKSYVLYRFFGGDELLYVGLTENPGIRFGDHQRYQSWYKSVTRATMEHFNSRAELKAAELKAIRTENPKYNVTGKPRPKPPPSPPRSKSFSLAHRPRGGSVFGPDASSFRAPDAIADEGDDDEDWQRGA